MNNIANEISTKYFANLPNRTKSKSICTNLHGHVLIHGITTKYVVGSLFHTYRYKLWDRLFIWPKKDLGYVCSQYISLSSVGTVVFEDLVKGEKSVISNSRKDSLVVTLYQDVCDPDEWGLENIIVKNKRKTWKKALTWNKWFNCKQNSEFGCLLKITGSGVIGSEEDRRSSAEFLHKET